MKLSELKPCASCGGPLRGDGIHQWYVVRVSQAMLNPRGANEVLGMTQFFQGALALAECFAPRSDDAVWILGEKEPELYTTVHLCMDCYYGKPLGLMIEEIKEKVEAAAE